MVIHSFALVVGCFAEVVESVAGLFYFVAVVIHSFALVV